MSCSQNLLFFSEGRQKVSYSPLVYRKVQPAIEMIALTGLCSAQFCSGDAGHCLTVDDVWLVCDKVAISNQIAIVGNHQFIQLLYR